jgi:hypothetical protein
MKGLLTLYLEKTANPLLESGLSAFTNNPLFKSIPKPSLFASRSLNRVPFTPKTETVYEQLSAAYNHKPVTNRSIIDKFDDLTEAPLLKKVVPEKTPLDDIPQISKAAPKVDSLAKTRITTSIKPALSKPIVKTRELIEATGKPKTILENMLRQQVPEKISPIPYTVRQAINRILPSKKSVKDTYQKVVDSAIKPKASEKVNAIQKNPLVKSPVKLDQTTGHDVLPPLFANVLKRRGGLSASRSAFAAQGLRLDDILMRTDPKNSARILHIIDDALNKNLPEAWNFLRSLSRRRINTRRR